MLLLGLETIVAVGLVGRELDLGYFLLALLAALVLCMIALQIYALHSLLHTVYVLDETNLTIRYGEARYIVPFSAIGNVLPMQADSWQLKLELSLIPSYPVHQGRLPGLDQITFIGTTRSVAYLVLITAPEIALVISPKDRDDFVADLNARRAQARPQPLSISQLRPKWMEASLWRDAKAVKLLLLGIIANLFAIGYVSYKYPTLAPLLPLHYNSAGEIDFIGTRLEAFKIPAIGTITLAADLLLAYVLHPREKLASYLLLTVAIVVQAIIAVATIKIVY